MSGQLESVDEHAAFASDLPDDLQTADPDVVWDMALREEEADEAPDKPFGDPKSQHEGLERLRNCIARSRRAPHLLEYDKRGPA